VSDPIIVVGAGPVGLTAAGELARRGVPVRIIDQREAPTDQSRAIVVHSRSLEMFERIGVVDEIIAAGVRTDAMEMHADGKLIIRIELSLVDSHYPYSVTLAQTETERILTGALSGHGVSVERGVTLTALEQDAEGVRVTLRHPDGHDEVATCPWLVGADGAHSDVRHQVGSALAGSFKGERFLMGDVHAAHSLDPHTMLTFFSPHDGPLLAFPMKGDRMRLIAQIPVTAEAPATQEWLQQVIDERSDSKITIHDALWLTKFDVRHAQVPQYRVGRVFLAGDAAHVHSPAGGQGMNTGMQDAFNLGWKLARVSRSGSAGGSVLLDSYHAERHPVGAKVIEFTTALTRAATVTNPIVQKLRNHAVHAATALAPVRTAMADKTEEVALSYRGSPIVVASTTGGKRGSRIVAGDHLPEAAPGLGAALARESGHVLLTIAPERAVPSAPAPGSIRQILVTAADAPAADGAAERDGYDAVIDDPDQAAATRYGLPHGGRIMVRPDGYVAAVAPLDDDAPLRAYGAMLSR
jgi:2-polyprenyl-6-methoxyphenol hydroxylase-like FAD-dependent oxidoreductase